MARDTPVPPVSPSPGEHPDAAGQDAASPAGTGQPPAAVETSPGAATQAPRPQPSKPRQRSKPRQPRQRPKARRRRGHPGNHGSCRKRRLRPQMSISLLPGIIQRRHREGEQRDRRLHAGHVGTQVLGDRADGHVHVRGGVAGDELRQRQRQDHRPAPGPGRRLRLGRVGHRFPSAVESRDPVMSGMVHPILSRAVSRCPHPPRGDSRPRPVALTVAARDRRAAVWLACA